MKEPIPIVQNDEAAQIVKATKDALAKGDSCSWKAADGFLALAQLGWKQTRIAKEYCRHCHSRPAYRARGLCRVCYGDPGLRLRYPKLGRPKATCVHCSEPKAVKALGLCYNCHRHHRAQYQAPKPLPKPKKIRWGKHTQSRDVSPFAVIGNISSPWSGPGRVLVADFNSLTAAVSFFVAESRNRELELEWWGGGTQVELMKRGPADWPDTLKGNAA